MFVIRERLYAHPVEPLLYCHFRPPVSLFSYNYQHARTTLNFSFLYLPSLYSIGLSLLLFFIQIPLRTDETYPHSEQRKWSPLHAPPNLLIH